MKKSMYLMACPDLRRRRLLPHRPPQGAPRDSQGAARPAHLHFDHFIGDDRDTTPNSSTGYAKDLNVFIDQIGIAKIATIICRYYVKDRDERWERVTTAVRGLVNIGKKSSSDYVQ
jgi:bisphosphoglycerate-independent phosphoglycerate mutase (AlkP superfamily)